MTYPSYILFEARPAPSQQPVDVVEPIWTRALTFYREAAIGPAAIARTNTSPCCSWKSVAGLVGSNFGQPTGGSLGICCATAGSSAAGAERPTEARRRLSGCDASQPHAPARNAAPDCGLSSTSTFGVIPTPWIERPDGV